MDLTLDLAGDLVTLPATPFQRIPYAMAAGTSLDGGVWTRAGDHAVYEDGNVGIGIDTPDRLLHVAGPGDQFLRLGSTSSGTSIAGLELIRGSAFSATDFRMINDGGRLKFQSAIDNFSGVPSDHLAVASSGSVGIGTLDPESKLSLHDSGDVGLSIRSTGTQDSYIDLLRGQGASNSDWRMVNHLGTITFRTARDIGNEEGACVLSINPVGWMAVGDFVVPAAKIHLRGIWKISWPSSSIRKACSPRC